MSKFAVGPPALMHGASKFVVQVVGDAGKIGPYLEVIGLVSNRVYRFGEGPYSGVQTGEVQGAAARPRLSALPWQG